MGVNFGVRRWNHSLVLRVSWAKEDLMMSDLVRFLGWVFESWRSPDVVLGEEKQDGVNLGGNFVYAHRKAKSYSQPIKIYSSLTYHAHVVHSIHSIQVDVDFFQEIFHREIFFWKFFFQGIFFGKFFSGKILFQENFFWENFS